MIETLNGGFNMVFRADDVGGTVRCWGFYPWSSVPSTHPRTGKLSYEWGHSILVDSMVSMNRSMQLQRGFAHNAPRRFSQ